MNSPELFFSCNTVVCDLDGTLYLEDTLLPAALEFTHRILDSGRQLFYFTNNTSKSRATYLAKFSSLGLPAEDSFLITAADCADDYLKRSGLHPEIYLVGNRDLKKEFGQRGFNCLGEEETGKTPPRAVVLGFDTELTYAKIKTCYDLILAKTPYIATHADLLCPLARGRFMPDVGSFISLFETATGGLRPHVVGKPTGEAVRAICGRAGQPPGKVAFVGDRLYTDMRMAARHGMVGVLVLSGETSADMAARSPDQPKLMVNGVADLIDGL